MARIRTVKPALFKHSALFDAEREMSLPLRLAFIGLFTVCDRAGRFKWRPRELGVEVLPYDGIDFSRVLDALATRGFVVKYASAGVEYGCIPTFSKHQVINNREAASELPDFEEGSEIQILDACATREARGLDLAQAEGKGREGKGTGRERKEVDATASRPPAKTSDCWAAYSSAYFTRYGTVPVRNAKVNALLGQLVDRLGAEDAPPVAAFYVGHNNGYYVQKGHAVDALVSDAEKLRTEWVTNRKVTQTQARQADKTASNPFAKMAEENRNAGRT